MTYTCEGLSVKPIGGTLRRVAGGLAVDIRISDPRSTVTHAVVNADTVLDEGGRPYLAARPKPEAGK